MTVYVGFGIKEESKAQFEADIARLQKQLGEGLKGGAEKAGEAVGEFQGAATGSLKSLETQVKGLGETTEKAFNFEKLKTVVSAAAPLIKDFAGSIGGLNKEQQTTNPAWDFQYLLPKYEVNKEYTFRCRLVYRERCGRAEVLKEVENWRKGL